MFNLQPIEVGKQWAKLNANWTIMCSAFSTIMSVRPLQVVKSWNYIQKRKEKPLFANARSIKNALDRARMRQANRIFDSRGQVLTKKELVNIEAEDILQSTVFN